MSRSAQAAAWEPRYAGRAARMRASEIRELLKVLDQPGIISFAGGIPDPALFPVQEAKAAYAAVLSDAAQAGSGLQYSVSEGYCRCASGSSGTWRPWACPARPTTC